MRRAGNCDQLELARMKKRKLRAQGRDPADSPTASCPTSSPECLSRSRDNGRAAGSPRAPIRAFSQPQRTMADRIDDGRIRPKIRGREARITPRLIDSLYTEAMLLADEARAYFDEAGRDERQTLEPFARVGFACESLKVTTRIMHIVAWLLTQRAVESGEIKAADGRRPERRLGHANDSDPAGRRPAAASGAAADQRQRRPLCAGQAPRRGPAGRRAGAKPGARADGPAGARPRSGIATPDRIRVARDAALHLPSRPAAARPATAQPRGWPSCCPTGPCLFVTDRDVVALGLTDAVPRRRSRRAGARSSCSTRSRPIRRRKRCSRRSSWARRHDVTSVVGFGGGSPMDVAKLAAYLLGSGDDLDAIWGVDLAKGQHLPLALVPTTAGHRLAKRRRSRSSPAKAAMKLAVNSPAADRRLGRARCRR